jgi:hypothetical protein
MGGGRLHHDFCGREQCGGLDGLFWGWAQV